VLHHANEQVRDLRVGVDQPRELGEKRESRSEGAHREERNKQADFLIWWIFRSGCWFRRRRLLCFRGLGWGWEARGGTRLRRGLQWCSHSKLGDFGVVDTRVDGGHVRFVPLVIQFIIRWGQMGVKVIQGDEVLSNEEGRGEK
jgi:hypothetical protein